MDMAWCRDHLILWDLDSGYIKGRIKTSYKETLLSSMDRDSQIMSLKEKTGIKMYMKLDFTIAFIQRLSPT